MERLTGENGPQRQEKLDSHCDKNAKESIAHFMKKLGVSCELVIALVDDKGNIVHYGAQNGCSKETVRSLLESIRQKLSHNLSPDVKDIYVREACRIDNGTLSRKKKKLLHRFQRILGASYRVFFAAKLHGISWKKFGTFCDDPLSHTIGMLTNAK